MRGLWKRSMNLALKSLKSGPISSAQSCPWSCRQLSTMGTRDDSVEDCHGKATLDTDFNALYGPVDSDSTVIAELKQSAGLSRLAGVLQGGIVPLIGEGVVCDRAYSRLEHSIGVMQLIQRLGGSEKEQIAGLLHDVSHTAFSHVVDYVFDLNVAIGESFHESIKAAYLRDSDLSAVLERNGHTWSEFCHEEYFTLLEQDAPKLCADRLDYFFRDGIAYGLFTPDHVTRAVADLVSHRGQIVVTNVETALWLFASYLELDRSVYRAPFNLGQYMALAAVINSAMNAGNLSRSDLHKYGDRVLWARLQSTADHGSADMRALKNNVGFRAVASSPSSASPTAFAAYPASCRVRFIDPPVLIGDHVVALSELDSNVAAALSEHKATGQVDYWIEAFVQ